MTIYWKIPTTGKRGKLNYGNGSLAFALFASDSGDFNVLSTPLFVNLLLLEFNDSWLSTSNLMFNLLYEHYPFIVINFKAYPFEFFV